MPKFQWLTATLVGLAVSATTLPAWAGANDYEFEAIAKEVRNGPGSELAVRLIHKPDGKLVEGAVVFKTRLDMAPDNMAGMVAEVAAVSATAPGVYKFRADLTMAGSWALTLQAKVQGEPETVRGTVVFTAKN